MVATTSPCHEPRDASSTLPLCSPTRKREPNIASPATAPSSTTSPGLTTPSSASSQNSQALISVLFGRWWIRRLPRAVHLKCLTAFVRYTSSRAMPLSASARSSTRPAGPTNGRPCLSSWSPGVSPTSTSAASTGPSPNTVPVARLYRSHRVHEAALSASSRQLVTSGSYPAAPAATPRRHAPPSRPAATPRRHVRGLTTRQARADSIMRARRELCGAPAGGAYRVRVDELSDSSHLVADPDGLRRRLAADGYLFFRGLLPEDDIWAAGQIILERLRAGGWVDD